MSFFKLPAFGHIFWRASAVISIIILLLLTLLPSVNTGINFNNIDKVYHFVAFAGVTFLFMSAFINLNRVTIAISMIILGFAIEVIQYQIPGRDFSWLDWLADCAGVLAIAIPFPKRKKIKA
ncbi:MAG: VanZ family protein [Gammaproteobacteria bacterium]|nr:VanZ family protein [Gammaproteobacteria bacterium]